MIEIKSLASSSKGNAYVVSDGVTNLLVECGISWKQIQILSGWINFDAILVSHQHIDHCKGVIEAQKTGIDIYVPETAKRVLKLVRHNVIGLSHGQTFKVGTFNIMPFDLQHDVPTLGYLMASSNGDKICFISDSFYCKYKFNGVTHWMLEANNSKDILDERVQSGELHSSLRNRIVKSHMSLDTLKEMLLANDLSKTEEIWLLHLSDGNSDEARFKREVQEITGKVVILA